MPRVKTKHAHRRGGSGMNLGSAAASEFMPQYADLPRTALRQAIMLALAWVPAAAWAAPSPAGAPAPSPAGAPAPSPAGAPAPGPAAVSFDSSFFGSSGQSLDLDRFKQGNPVAAGEYRVDVRLNGTWMMRETVHFAAVEGSDIARPCLPAELLQRLGVKLDDGLQVDSAGCIDLGAIDANTSAHYNTSEQRLDLSIPQASLVNRPRDYIDPGTWDAGVTAGTLSYTFNTFSSENAGKRNTTSSLSLNAGLNLGRWRLRQYSSATFGGNQGSTWNSISAYAERDLPALRAQLTIGDASTNGELFGSTRFRGVRIASDDRMLPQSMRGYAPTVRGVANSNARVQIHQNDTLIYDIAVAPGAFEINDLPASGGSGDLTVTITENDGTVRTLIVPYASVAQLLRPGQDRFSATLGTLRDSGLSDDVGMLEATWQRGLTNAVTGYTGLQLSDDSRYRALVGGVALNTPVGAVALDTTFTSAKLRQPGGGDEQVSGTSSRVTYSNRLSSTNTTFSLAAYRYSTEGYRTLQETALHNDRWRRVGQDTPGDDRWDLPTQRQKSTFQLNMHQPLGNYGTVYVTGSAQNYWNRPGSDRQYMAGYNHSIGRANYGISASRTRLPDGRWDNQYNVGVSMPLGASTRGRHQPTLSLSADRRGDGSTGAMASVAGSAGRSSQISYGANASRNGDNTSFGVNGGYQSSIGSVSGSYSRSNGNDNFSANISGAVVAFPGGVALAPRLGDTIGVIEAKGATGSRTGTTGISRVNRRGHAVVPNLAAYQRNQVNLDPQGASLDFELKNSSQQVVPRAGAVVKVKFEVDSGRAAVITARQGDGSPLPFGADVLDEEGKVIGVVGQGSRMLARVSRDVGVVRVAWSDADTGPRQCMIDYRLPAAAGTSDTTVVDGACRIEPGDTLVNAP